MKVDWSMSVCDIPMQDIRDFCRWARRSSFGTQAVQDRLRIARYHANDVIDDLHGLGFIEADPSKLQFPYKLTAKGLQLACARKIPRMSRAKADVELSGFMSRITQVNECDELAYYASEARIFGSYIDPSATDFGDLDIAVDLKFRSIHGRVHKDYVWARADILRDTRKSPYIVCRNEVLRRLRGKSRYLSLCELGAPEQMGAAWKLLFRCDPSEAHKDVISVL